MHVAESRNLMHIGEVGPEPVDIGGGVGRQAQHDGLDPMPARIWIVCGRSAIPITKVLHQFADDRQSVAQADGANTTADYADSDAGEAAVINSGIHVPRVNGEQPYR